MPSAHVLLVDDSTTVRMVIAAELREAGFRVTPVPTLDAARRALTQASSRGAIDLIILDLTLPDGDGIDLLREIRRDPEYVDMPVMILSSDARFGSRLRGLGVGADDFVGRPHSKAYLIGRARALAGTRIADIRNSSSAPRPWRILIVDSDMDIRQTLARHLRVGHGCDVVTLENTDQAAQYFDVEGMGADCVIVERRGFLRLLGLVQQTCPAGLPMIVLDDGPNAALPAPVVPRRASHSRSALVVPRSMDLNAIAEAVLLRLNEEDEEGNPRVARGSIPPPRSTPLRLARGA
ncbi:MAG TPA: response regulator [Polyangium sp.]|nr:response regulator [Polyangium sp.]